MSHEWEQWHNDPRVGDRISYGDVNQWNECGVIVSIDPPSMEGQFCRVKWDRFPLQEATELLSNLIAWR
jgi:hypothetical protein